MRFLRGLAAGLAVSLTISCGGGTSSSGGGLTGGGSTGGSYSMGSLATMDDSTQFTLTNATTGQQLGIANASQTAGASVVQTAATAQTDDLWHFLPMNNNGEYNIENLLTHQVMGIQNASSSAGALAVQWADNGTADHLWQFYQLSDGNYLLRNANSGLYLEAANSGSNTTTAVDQGTRSSSSGCACQEWKIASTGQAAYPAPIAVNVSYTAPDSAVVGIHDPSLLKTGSGYVLFSTHGTIHAHISPDRVNFTDAGFALSALPAWTSQYTAGSGDLWAPDASAHGGVYWLYFAASTFGSSNSAIGLATSSSGTPGTFADSGAAVYTSANCPGANAIDPASVVDSSGNAWLVFGSWSSGIQIVPVSAATGIPTGGACTQLAYHPSGTGIEGAYVYPHGGYYYLFASIDTCCQGVSSTYRIIVGRSTSVTGPYTDRGGVALTQGGGTILLSAHSNINGPGGESVMHDTDGDLLVYHYYDGNTNGYPALGLNLLSWTSDGWPWLQ